MFLPKVAESLPGEELLTGCLHWQSGRGKGTWNFEVCKQVFSYVDCRTEGAEYSTIFINY